MVNKLSPDNIPYAFSHLVELSQLPTESTYDVVFNNKTLDQALQSGVAGVSWEEDDPFGGPDIFFSDPDALDKAKWQADKPNAIMTPWGPALAPEAADAIIGDSPGVQELLGLTDEEIAAVTASADAIIDGSGDNLDEILSQADAAAMTENLNPTEVGIGILDEMMNMSSIGDSSGVQELLGLTDEEIAAVTASAPDGVAGVSWEEDDPFGGMASGTGQAVPPVPQLSTTPVPDPLGAVDDVASADRQFLDSLLDLTDSQILSLIDEAMKDWLPAESVVSWVQDHPERYNLGQAVLELASVKDEVPTDIDTTKTTEDDMSAAEAAKLGGQTYGGPSEIVNKELDKIYFETTGALPDKRASEAETLFWLYRHEAVGSQFDNREKVGSLYKPFLIDYINNRYKYTSGPEFDAAIRRLSEQLTKGPDGTLYGTFVQNYFGGDKGDITRRNILIKLYNSGSSYGPSEMHSGIETGMAGLELMGKTPAEIFALYTMPKYIPGAETQDPFYDIFAGDGAVTSEAGAAPPYPYDVSGLQNPALSFTPELYSPGKRQIGTPGETMAMRYPRFRTDPYQPPSTVHGRTGVQDPALSFTSELYSPGKRQIGTPGETFGATGDLNTSLGNILGKNTTNWGVDSTMVIPNINAAALPISSPDPAEVAAYLAAQEAKMPWNTMPASKGIYGEAMAQLADTLPGTSYKPSGSTVAVKGISTEMLESMPEPYDDEERERRSKGLPYKTGHWKGDLWVKGTTFMPTKKWKPNVPDSSVNLSKEGEWINLGAPGTGPPVVVS